MKYNSLLLEKIRANEIHVDELLEGNVANSFSAQEEVQKLKESDERILQEYPLDLIKNAVQKKIELRNEEKKHVIKLTFVQNYRYATFAVAAALALAVGTFIVFEQRSNASFNSNEIRMKGNGSLIFVYRKNATGYERLSSNDSVQENDVLQISYISGNATWGAILSVDGNGNVTQHYPEYGPKAAVLIKNREVSLDFSYRLDGAPFYENFIFITSEKTFDIAIIKKEISSYVRKGNSVSADFIQNLNKNTTATNIYLQKTGTQ